MLGGQVITVVIKDKSFQAMAGHYARTKRGDMLLGAILIREATNFHGLVGW